MSDFCRFPELTISGSALKAERLRMQAVAENIANINTTRQNGEIAPYQRKEVVFSELLDVSEPGSGVTASVEQDGTPPVLLYRPGHPDANEQGYVSKPNIDMHFEMVDLISAARSYQANLLAMKLSKEMAQRTLSLGQ